MKIKRLASLALSLVLAVLLCTVCYVAWVSEDIGTADVDTTAVSPEEKLAMTWGGIKAY